MISLTSEVQTPYHRWPAGPKLLGLCLFTLLVFYLDTVLNAGAALALVMLAYGLGGRLFARQGLRMMVPILWMTALIGLFHLLVGRIEEGVIVILRLLAAVALANLVTMTTRLEQMLNVIEGLLRRCAVPGHVRRRMALAVALVVRFTPVLTQKGAALTQAWRARTVKRPGWRLVLPFVLLAVDDAEQVAEALKARSGGI